MNAEDVAGLYRALEDAGIRVWIVGGWGVDALLRRQTREHHDLDLVVDAPGAERMRVLLEERGFRFAYVWWEEVWWVRDPAWSSPVQEPTAFVYRDDAGREIDVHVLRTRDGEIEMLWTAPYAFTSDGLSGRGVVGEAEVRCLTAAMQRSAHSGYELPPHHVRDVELLDELD